MSARLSCANAEAREREVLSLCGGCGGGGLPPVSALQAGSFTGYARVDGNIGHGVESAAARLRASDVLT